VLIPLVGQFLTTNVVKSLVHYDLGSNPVCPLDVFSRFLLSTLSCNGTKALRLNCSLWRDKALIRLVQIGTDQLATSVDTKKKKS